MSTGVVMTVREKAGGYTFKARFPVVRPAAMAFAVLTDYERIPTFIPNVRLSSIVGQRPGHVLLEQSIRTHVMMFRRDIHLILDVENVPGIIWFRDRCRESFSHYEGQWRIIQLNGQMTVCYDLNMKPAFTIPKFILTTLLKREARSMMGELQAEIAARSRRATDTFLNGIVGGIS